jgi:hypothetical protein
MTDGFLRPSDKGWADTVYVVVKTPIKEMSQPEEVDAELVGVREKGTEEATNEEYLSVGYSSDSYKRKLEDDGAQRASKNPRSQSPDNYAINVSQFE